MHILEVLKEKLDFNLDIRWFKLEKYTLFKIKFQFLKIVLHCFLFDQQSFLTISQVWKRLFGNYILLKSLTFCKKICSYFHSFDFCCDVLEFLSAYFGVFSAYFGSF